MKAKTIIISIESTPINGETPEALNIPAHLDASGIVQLMKEDSDRNKRKLLDDWALLSGIEINVTVIDEEDKRTSDSWADE